MTDDLLEGYPETEHPAWGHPAYNLAAHFFNAISSSERRGYYFPFSVRQIAARKATTVAVHFLNRALAQAVDAIVDTRKADAPAGGLDGDSYWAGYEDAQSDAAKAVLALQQRLTGGILPESNMLVPEVVEPTS